VEETGSSRFISLGALFFAVIILASLFGPFSFVISAAAETSGDYEFELINGDTGVKIKKYLGLGGDAVIPGAPGPCWSWPGSWSRSGSPP
jgi:hypothetical protein